MVTTAPPLIVHVIWRLAIGGMENGLVNLINRTPADRYRHVIICVADATDFAERLNGRVEVVALNRNKAGQDPALQIALWQQFRRLRPTIVHTRNAATIEAAIAARLALVPKVVHSEHGWDSSDPDGSNRKRQVLRRLCKPFINEFIALSAFQARYLRDKIDVPKSRLTELCNGVDTERFKPARQRQLLPPGFAAPDCVVIGTVGRHDPIKDTENLIRAFAELRSVTDNFSALRLVLVGDGPLSVALKQLATELDIDRHVWFAGARDDIPELLNSLDVFVLPSKSEGISNSILEAMACGLPVVATDVGGNHQLVFSGETGALVPANNPNALARSILPLVSDPQLRDRFSQNARLKAVGEFSLTAMVDRYLTVYDRLTKAC